MPKAHNLNNFEGRIPVGFEVGLEVRGRTTKKLQRMTPNPTNPNPTSNHDKIVTQKLQKLPHIYVRIH
jgi:hypothetical protein